MFHVKHQPTGYDRTTISLRLCTGAMLAALLLAAVKPAYRPAFSLPK
jgi:hypothetical protein